MLGGLLDGNHWALMGGNHVAVVVQALAHVSQNHQHLGPGQLGVAQHRRPVAQGKADLTDWHQTAPATTSRERSTYGEAVHQHIFHVGI
ncbi:hypothetical protein DSO57_1039596 [Entomophthora muscae]|uniref:Uncharacterized protein n=1 Tax=Entomophthora muscae TaxID=34485 RepID=A0ACC2RUI8_9FUNG|nr:hypothetical protein DSO57_1039596 [Entomophthora muscae]